MQASLALTIPTLLLSGPIVGYLLGLGLQKWLGWHEWIVFVMVLMGLAAGIRETIIVIRKLSAATKD
jgi:F0F1-type ATP synthase assembly protein I